MNILIIDDTPADHDISVEYLEEEEKNHYTFFHAYSGAEGLAMYQERRPDCVLLDYNLPDMNGLEVLRRLSEMEEAIPVIMMTGEGNEMIAVTAMKLGSQDYIPKKVVTSSALKRAVDRAAERTEMIRRMEQYRADLIRSNQDLEQFATIVAHDLKSPLRAITQHLELIEQRNADRLDEKSLQSMAFVYDGAKRMRVLIDALFTYARLGFGEPNFAPVDMGKVLRLVQQDLAAVIQEKGAVITHDPLPKVQGDQILLAQLLQNLIGNAIKYCTSTPHIHLSATTSESDCCFEVRDNGIGIAPEQQQKIFSIFRRLHREEEYPGIGLGLAVCERIVHRHGGMIGVESEPGKGSRFWFTIG